jgi:hypothetical protein
MDVVANSHCDSSWKYIPFAFNQTDIEQVKKLSQTIGIKHFVVSPSDRFDDQTHKLMPAAALIGARYSAQVAWKSNNSKSTVDPKCQSGREHFITAEGYYSPCCFLADHRFYYKTPFGKNKKQYSIDQYTLSQILERLHTIEFYQELDQQPGCQYSCPATFNG